MDEYVYASLMLYPTRDGTTHILATWNSSGVSYRVDKVYWTRLFFTTANSVKLNDDWTNTDSNPFSDSIGNVEQWNISCGDGDLYQGWSSDDGKRVLFAVCYHSSEEDDQHFKITWALSGDEISSNYITSSAPSVSYNNGQITIGTCCSGKRVIEFHRTDIPFGGNTGITDEAALNEMMWTAFLETEAGSGFTVNPYAAYYWLTDKPVLHRWGRGTYNVRMTAQNSTNRELISSAIDNAISEINAVLNAYGIRLERNDSKAGDIEITVGPESTLFPNRPSNYYYGGTWSTNEADNGQIVSATIKLANDFRVYAPYSTYETVAFEELLQCMGAGYDQVEYPYQTIHTDFNYYNKASSMYRRDADILRLIYSDSVQPGDSYHEVCRKLNVPKGCYVPSGSTSNSALIVNAAEFLTRGGTYEVRAFIVDSGGRVSGTSQWVTITVPEIVISKWSWTASNGSANAAKTQQFYNVLRGNAYPENGFSYLVWNDLVEKTKEVITVVGRLWVNYSGITSWEGCKVSNGEAFSANKYNALRFQLGSVVSTGITDRNNGDEILGRYVTRLADVINEIIDTKL